MGDTQFHFRTRLCPGNQSSITTAHEEYNKNCLTPLEVSILALNLVVQRPASFVDTNCAKHLAHFQADNLYFYGHVYFRQIKDRAARRGYLQKSLVLITRLPFVTLFSNVVSVLANQFFENGDAGLESGT